MPPIRSQKAQKSVEQEGRILLAVKAIKNKEISSIREAARCFDVPRATLQDRLRGYQFRHEARANSHKLTQYEEESLIEWILSMDLRGNPPRPSMAKDMANLLLASRGTIPSPTVGINWVSTFIKCHKDMIASRFSRRYDYQRAQCEDPTVIREWFDSVQRVIVQYGIADEDIFNFDETGFAMGLTATAKIITRAEYCGKRSMLQPGNREWVTVIESICAQGWALPLYIIFKGKVFIESWFNDLPDGWKIDKSKNRWTTDDISLNWLKNHFIPYIYGRSKGKYRLLILDGHGSYLTAQFDQICKEHNIISICIPAHSSHLLQPLDVGCFASLKCAYSGLVKDLMRKGISHIDKLDFFAAYPDARIRAFKDISIQNSFKATGLIPFDPISVLAKINIYIKTPTSPPTRGSNSSADFIPITPHNTKQLRRQASSVKTLLKYRSQSPSTPTKAAIDQLIKGCHMAMHSAVLLAEENRALCAANARKKQKRSRSKRQIPHDTALNTIEARALIQASQYPVEAEASVSTEIANQASTHRIRAPPRCSGCGVIGHKINRCPKQ
ncbi:hypothetical protein VI817_009978 [Penicillium citrinum]|nr:hypothetical protein VI817_009978 [Penicillium citrinum]